MIRKFLNFFSKKKTKLGVNFILFDGEELLEHAIKPIRDQADFISVVYQTESYHGRTCSPELEATLFQLKSSGLIDEICHFKPNTIIPGQYNELKQRNIGLELSRKKNCTHHISMDCDEIYIEEEFKRAKEQMISGGYDATFCELKYYYKSSKYEMVELPESILVSLFIKINKNTKFNTKLEYPFFVEPTRRVELGKYKVYAKDEVLMHHLSYVRKNIRLKLENSANLGLYEAHLDSVVSYFEDWEYPEKGLLAAASFFYVEIQQSESNLPLIEFQQGKSKITELIHSIYQVVQLVHKRLLIAGIREPEVFWFQYNVMAAVFNSVIICEIYSGSLPNPKAVVSVATIPLDSTFSV